MWKLCDNKKRLLNGVSVVWRVRVDSMCGVRLVVCSSRFSCMASETVVYVGELLCVALVMARMTGVVD